jgi:serine/threonine-protein kinase PknG
VNCSQPGCTGEIVDGYCDLCGMAPARAAATPVAAGAGGGQPSAPAPLPAISSTPTATSLTSARRSATSRTRSTTGHRLGAGLVEIPSVPARDPFDAVMTDPMVPENRRFCATCDEPVGRGRDGTPGRAAGFCRKCG